MGKPWLHPITRERHECKRWDAMRLALVGAERDTNIAVVPDAHCIDPTVGNARRQELVIAECAGAMIIMEHRAIIQ